MEELMLLQKMASVSSGMSDLLRKMETDPIGQLIVC